MKCRFIAEMQAGGSLSVSRIETMPDGRKAVATVCIGAAERAALRKLWRRFAFDSMRDSLIIFRSENYKGARNAKA